jgi:hypothetical protein
MRWLHFKHASNFGGYWETAELLPSAERYHSSAFAPGGRFGTKFAFSPYFCKSWEKKAYALVLGDGLFLTARIAFSPYVENQIQNEASFHETSWRRKSSGSAVYDLRTSTFRTSSLLTSTLQ